ncbi:hypothetical protein GE061_003426 [Apolygus lucorum]|uniref:Uncharacterized protein n=1 Tax=Apolygus lucorum TaxID=248454 RepID=A0A8S9X3I2_APOLU|nr:hypothetical protein GE061_003426 [Apolygus lucorum]
MCVYCGEFSQATSAMDAAECSNTPRIYTLTESGIARKSRDSTVPTPKHVHFRKIAKRFTITPTRTPKRAKETPHSNEGYHSVHLLITSQVNLEVPGPIAMQTVYCTSASPVNMPANPRETSGSTSTWNIKI